MSQTKPTDSTSALEGRSPPPRSQGPRIVGIAVLAGAITQLVLAASAVDSPLAASAKGEALALGKPIERELRPGETHVYEVVVPADRMVNGIVDQRGVDVLVRIVDPSGAIVRTIDSPNGMVGPEPWSIEGTPGTWRIEVSCFPDTKKPGRYQARVDESITLEEREERRATQRYPSPRLRRLWKERRAEGAVARFVDEMKGHAPLVEPVTDDPRGDVLITFVRQAPPEARYVGLLGAPTATGDEVALTRFEDTDLHYVTLRTPRDARFSYRFRVGAPPNASLSPKDSDAALRLSMDVDPWNPRIVNGNGFVELPAAPAQTWAEPTAGAPAGHVVARTIHSAILGEDRVLGVYLPPGFDPAGGPYPYVIVFDGETYGNSPGSLIPTPVILDNLLAQGKVPPMLAVLVDSQSTRNRDLPMSAPFGDFLAKEVAPWVRREYRATEDPAKVTLAGSSFGGLCAAYSAFHHPDVFGNALSQSGSFWYSPGALDEATPFRLETGALMREIVAAPSQRVRFWMEVGLFEGTSPLAGGNQVGQNRHMRDVLLAKGYRVAYHEYTGGHDYASWRGSLADGLITLAGAAPP
jgi:enterochelin esterase family protein